MKKRIVAFKEITFSKLIAIFFILVFTGVFIVGLCIQKDIFEYVMLLSGIVTVIVSFYFGKSTIENKTKIKTPNEIVEPIFKESGEE